MKPAIRLVSSMATRALLEELVDAWHARGGPPVAVESIGGVEVARRVAAGEPFDVVVLAAEAIDRLIESGHALAGSRTDLVRSGVAIAVRHGAPHPRIGDEAALRAAVLGASRIAMSTGPSGVALQRLFAGWQLLETLRDRLVQAAPGVPVADLLARGDAELGFQQLSELLHAPGVDVVGPMPPGFEIVTTFSAAACSVGLHADAVQPLLDHLRAAVPDDAPRRHGMTPARSAVLDATLSTD